MALFSNAAKDAKKIQETIDYRVLKAAWDSYAQINVGSTVSTHRVATPAWYALFAIQNYNGKFDKFSVEELHLLEAISKVNTAYDDIITALELHSEDEDLARHILTTHPNLQEAVPHECDNVEKINEHIASVIRQYQSMLADFYKKYKKNIDATIKKLSDQQFID